MTPQPIGNEPDLSQPDAKTIVPTTATNCVPMSGLLYAMIHAPASEIERLAAEACEGDPTRSIDFTIARRAWAEAVIREASRD